MAKFKVIVSDPETGKSQVVELEGSRAIPLIGRRLGETIDGTIVGLGGHTLKIAGGSDKDGFSMRPDIHGGVKTRIIITRGPGFHAESEGERRRKTVRGSIITEDIYQVNTKIVEKPKKAEKAEKAKKPEPVEEKEETIAEEEAEKTEKPEKPAKHEKEKKSTKEEAEEGKEKAEETEAGG